MENSIALESLESFGSMFIHVPKAPNVECINDITLVRMATKRYKTRVASVPEPVLVLALYSSTMAHLHHHNFEVIEKEAEFYKESASHLESL